MWVTTLNIVTLLSLLGALGYVAFAARKLDAGLGALVAAQSESRRDLERQVERVRLSPVIPVGLSPVIPAKAGMDPRFRGDEVVVTTSLGCSLRAAGGSARRNESPRAGCCDP